VNGTKISGWVAGTSVSVLATLGGYTLHGPILSEPVVITFPDAVLGVLCHGAIGCYLPALPDFILLNEYGKRDPAALPHEMLHYTHPDWSECEVSTYLYSTTGLTDGYHVNGEC
jgi:hypothetical protein